ncbi:NAD(P)H-hydrate epimerase [Candidatus Woesearchaeota archaeon]|nr:NAD(P)H-hydrate epimerase [Candidatus Woesearchaeota archaeon]
MITPQRMKELEDQAEAQGISTLELMENAGREFVNLVKKKYDLTEKRVIIFAGMGNNGGDGLVAARYFAKDNPVLVLLFGNEEKMKEEAKKNLKKIKNPITIVNIRQEEDLKQFHFQENLNFLLVDALLGTGFKIPQIQTQLGQNQEDTTKINLTKQSLRPLVKIQSLELITLAINTFNSLPGLKISLDVPSGLDCEQGAFSEPFCHSDLVVCLHDVKNGLQTWQEKVVVVNIGIPFKYSFTYLISYL